MNLNRQYISIVLLSVVLLSLHSCRKSNFRVEPSEIVISDNGAGIGTTTWVKGKNYLLQGRVFVNDGQVLTIEPGAVIRFAPGQGAAASALIVARGGKIIAQGTAVDPIIFTAEADDLNGSLSIEEFGLWGGIILLGDAPVNTPSGENHVDGIPLSEPRAVYGGNNENDDSGILKYVSIRHAGTELSADNEINSLTLAGVGRKTIIENIEVIANADDGIEIFGGTVNLKRLIITYSEDDGLDVDLGYQGSIQFVCIIQHPNFGDKLLEIDGGEEIKTAHPYSLPIIYNLTAVGRGHDLYNNCVTFWDNAGGTIANSIFLNQGYGVELEFSRARHSSYTQWEIGNLNINNNIFYNVNNNQTESFFKLLALNDENVDAEEALMQEYFHDAGNRFADPGFEVSGNKHFLISDSPVLKENIAPLPEGNTFLEEVPFKGAFGAYNWAAWTLSYQSGLLN